MVIGLVETRVRGGRGKGRQHERLPGASQSFAKPLTHL